MESAAEEIRRMYENSAAGGQHRLIPPVAHRSAATASNNNANIISSIGNFANFNPQQLANEQLLQYTIVNYLQQQQQQQQQAAAANSGGAYQQLPQSASSATSHYGALPPSMQSAALLMQQSMAVAAAATAANSFQSSVPRPPSRLSSPHLHSGGMSLSQKRQASSPLNSYRSRSPTNFQSPPPAHSRRSASVSSRQSREESTSPVAQSSWSFEEQFKQVKCFSSFLFFFNFYFYSYIFCLQLSSETADRKQIEKLNVIKTFFVSTYIINDSCFPMHKDSRIRHHLITSK